MGECSQKKFVSWRIAVLFSILMCTIGTAIILIGYFSYIQKGNNEYDQAIKNPELKPSTIIGDYHIFMAPPSNIVEVITNYNSTDVFSANNTITVKIIAIVNDSTKQDSMIALPIGSTSDLSLITNQNINNTVKNFQIFKKNFINLDRSKKDLVLVQDVNDKSPTIIDKDHVFIGNQTWTPQSEGQLIFLILDYKNNTLIPEYPANTKDAPFIIYPSTAKLQADTNRHVLLESTETARTNSHVEGLTFVIIGLVFVGLGLEIPIHRWLT